MIRFHTLERACPVCNLKDRFVYCAGCKVMPYGREYQVTHRDVHNTQFTKAEKTCEKLQAEETKLRNLENGFHYSCKTFNELGRPFLGY